MSDESNPDPYMEEGVYAAAQEMIKDGLIVEVVNEDGTKTWKLTKKGIAQARRDEKKRRGH